MKNELIQNKWCEQLDMVKEYYQSVKGSILTDTATEVELLKFMTMARAAILRVSGKNSPYNEVAVRISEKLIPGNLRIGIMTREAKKLFGVIEALYMDLNKGYLGSLVEEIHADLFSDFLDMAHHLLQDGYKDAAAVIAGSSLEAHLRQLCEIHEIEIEIETKAGKIIPKKADRLNSDLAKVGAYSKLDQKSVTAWLDLRNNAAHGNYDKYENPQVALMLDGIRDFVKRVPA